MQKERKTRNYWNIKEHCYEEARKYTSRGEFALKSPRAYNAALKHKWLDDYTWFESKHKPKGFWENYDNNIQEAKKYHSRGEFQNRCSTAYRTAVRNNWIDNYTWLGKPQKPKNYWTEERCIEAADECESRQEFIEKFQSAYAIAKRKGYLKNYSWGGNSRKSNGYWNNYTRCYEAAQECTSRTEFMKKYPTAYHYSLKNGWLDSFTCLIRQDNPFTDNMYSIYAIKFIEQHAVYVGLSMNPNRRMKEHKNKESTVLKFAKANNIEVPDMEILENGLSRTEAQTMEEYHRKSFMEEGWNILNIAKTGLGSSSLGKLNRSTWNHDNLYEEAKKYHTRYEFQKNNKSAYVAAYEQGFLDEYTWFEVTQKPTGFWNEEHCYEEARKYKTRGEFAKKSPTAYGVSKKHGWINNYNWFVNGRTNNKRSKLIRQLTLEGQFVKEYPSVSEAGRQLGKNPSHICQCCLGQRPFAYGYRWEYVEQ